MFVDLSQRTLNPFRNDKGRMNIFSFDVLQHIHEVGAFSSRDLLNVCLVCKEWNSFFHPILQRVQRKKGFDIVWAIEHNMHGMIEIMLINSKCFTQDMAWCALNSTGDTGKIKLETFGLVLKLLLLDPQTKREFACVMNQDRLKYILRENIFDPSRYENRLLREFIEKEELALANILLEDERVKNAKLRFAYNDLQRKLYTTFTQSHKSTVNKMMQKIKGIREKKVELMVKYCSIIIFLIMNGIFFWVYFNY